jgi:RNA polymerase primary sigma factor
MKRPTESDRDAAILNGGALGVDISTDADVAPGSGSADNSYLSDGASLTLYLKDLRAIPVLAREQEIELAKARDAGESLALNHLLSTRLALDHVLGLGEKVRLGELAIREVVEGSDDPGSADYHEDQTKDAAD